MKEIWKDIKGYEGKYQISNLGNVKNLKTSYILKGVDTRGYLRVGFTKNKKVKLFRIHRLVAEAFIPNPYNKPEINHIDGNKHNNKITNLEWCTSQENTIHSYKNNLQKTYPVYQYDLNNNFINKFPTIKKAIEITKIYHISDCCNGKRKTAGGYIWKHIYNIK